MARIAHHVVDFVRFEIKGEGGMMMHINYKRWLLLACMVISFCSIRGQQASFESSFFASHYKKTLDACMHAWGELQELARNDELLPHERDTMFNIALGCLVFADFCAQKMIQEPKKGFRDEEVAYLLAVASKLQDSSKQVIQHLPEDYAACIELMLSSVRTKIEALF